MNSGFNNLNKIKKRSNKNKLRKKGVSIKPRPRNEKNMLNIDHRLRKLEAEPEIKYYDQVSPAFGLITNEATTPMVLIQPPLNDAPQGAGKLQRVGSEIHCKRLYVRLTIRTQTANIIENRVRFWIFWYRGSQATSPNPGELLDLTLPRSTYAFRNLYFNKEYFVLVDKTIVLIPPESLTATTTVPAVQIFDFTIPLDRKTTFAPGTGAAGNDTDITINNLKFGISTSAPDGPTISPQFFLSTRVLFTDV